MGSDDPLSGTLAERLRGLGFRTGAVVSNFVARRLSGLDQGCERYDDRMEERETRRPVPERRAADTTAAENNVSE